MLGVALGRQVAAQSHGDRTGGDLREPGRDDHGRGRGRDPGQPGRECERNGQPVGHADHDVADELAGGEVAFDVGGLVHRLVVPEDRRGGAWSMRADQSDSPQARRASRSNQLSK